MPHVPEPDIKAHSEFAEHIDTYWGPQRTVDAGLTQLLGLENPVLVPKGDEKGRRRKFQPERMRVGLASWAIKRATAFYPAMPAGNVFPGPGQRSKKGAEGG